MFQKCWLLWKQPVSVCSTVCTPPDVTPLRSCPCSSHFCIKDLLLLFRYCTFPKTNTPTGTANQEKWSLYQARQGKCAVTMETGGVLQNCWYVSNTWWQGIGVNVENTQALLVKPEKSVKNAIFGAIFNRAKIKNIYCLLCCHGNLM